MNAPATVDQGPAHRHREGDNLWYIHPTTGERFISVTSVLDFADKPALRNYWTPGLAARAALAHLPKLIRATRLTPCGRTNSRCRSGEDAHDWRMRCDACPCDECPTCVEVWLRDQYRTEQRRARERGSAVHAWIEQWALGAHEATFRQTGTITGLAEEYQPYARSWIAFTRDHGVTPDSYLAAEATTVNRKDGWGGTTDGIISIDAATTPKARELCERFGLANPTLMLDTKTREREEGAFYPEMALQLAAYRRGEAILLDDGTEQPMPATDGAIVVQLHPDGYHVRPVHTSDEEYAGFVALLGHARWSIERAAKVVSVWRNEIQPDGSIARVYTFPRTPLPDTTPVKPAKTTAPARKRIFTDEERDAAIARDEAKLITPKGGAIPKGGAKAKAAAAAERAENREQLATARKTTAAARKASNTTTAKVGPAQPALDEPAQVTVAEAVTASSRAWAKSNGQRPGYLPDESIPF